MGEPRHIIIHGHFYQPPRESPWTGLISPEHGAAPFQNWNERILSECYTANAHAHTMQGPVVHVRNNYESLSFDVGPTLAGWLQTHGKTAYRAMTRGDALSASAHGGHGNAIAQSYSHSILPLLPPRDRELQIRMGYRRFRFPLRAQAGRDVAARVCCRRRHARIGRGGGNPVRHPRVGPGEFSRPRRRVARRGTVPMAQRRFEPGGVPVRSRIVQHRLLRRRVGRWRAAG